MAQNETELLKILLKNRSTSSLLNPACAPGLKRKKILTEAAASCSIKWRSAPEAIATSSGRGPAPSLRKAQTWSPFIWTNIKLQQKQGGRWKKALRSDCPSPAMWTVRSFSGM